MKYIVSLNGKSYEVEVNETDAVITNVTTAAGAAPAPVAAPVAAPAAAPKAPAAPAAIENRAEIIAAVCAAAAEEMGTDISALRVVSFKKIS